MTKQEKIRVGMAQKVCQVDRSQWEKLTDADKEYYFGRADDYLEYLHSEDVVIKVKGELPWLMDNQSDEIAFAHYMAGWNNGLTRAKRDGFEAVESLVKEDSNG